MSSYKPTNKENYKDQQNGVEDCVPYRRDGWEYTNTEYPFPPVKVIEKKKNKVSDGAVIYLEGGTRGYPPSWLPPLPPPKIANYTN